MFSPLIRLGLLASFWLKYKSNIIKTLFAILALAIVHYVYQDVVELFSLNQQQNYLMYALVVKWLVILLIIGTYVFSLKSAAKNNQPLNVKKSAKTAAATNSTASSKLGSETADPFEQLRHKDKLRSRSDLMLEKKRLQK
ncbi:lipase chaperone [Catenovulum agarivorans]|uniref:lipase chaperone n=1 Tax=Catenovulum agarivorans TaxID=1172192 RepID=UPI0002E3CF53|nr:lipase chaperone [Catenovulum agarivorans]